MIHLDRPQALTPNDPGWGSDPFLALDRIPKPIRMVALWCWLQIISRSLPKILIPSIRLCDLEKKALAEAFRLLIVSQTFYKQN